MKVNLQLSTRIDYKETEKTKTKKITRLKP